MLNDESIKDELGGHTRHFEVLEVIQYFTLKVCGQKPRSTDRFAVYRIQNYLMQVHHMCY